MTGSGAPLVRRVPVAVAALGLAATVALSGCGGADTTHGSAHAGAAAVRVERQSGQLDLHYGWDHLARYCDETASRTEYISEIDGTKSGAGGVGAGPLGCAAGSGALKPLEGWRSAGAEYVRVLPVCDSTNGTLVYELEVNGGGGTTGLPGGCAPDRPRPGALAHIGGSQSLDGSSAGVQTFRDTGTGALLYVEQGLGGGGLAVDGQSDRTPGRIAVLTRWQALSDYVKVRKACDLGNGDLLYELETSSAVDLAVAPGGCLPVADGAVGLTAEQAPTFLRTTSVRGVVDSEHAVNATDYVDLANGAAITVTTHDGGGGIAVWPGAASAYVAGLGD